MNTSRSDRMNLNPEPLAIVERRDNVTAFARQPKRSRADRRRVWVALGGDPDDFDTEYPPDSDETEQ